VAPVVPAPVTPPPASLSGIDVVNTEIAAGKVRLRPAFKAKNGTFVLTAGSRTPALST